MPFQLFKLFVNALVFLFCCFAFAQSNESNLESANKYAVALIDFEVNASGGAEAPPNLGQQMLDELKIALTDSPRFDVIEIDSGRLEDILAEIARSEEGQVDSGEAQEFGRFRGISIIINGSITVAPESFDIKLFFTDVASRQVSAADRFRTQDKGIDSLIEAATVFLERAEQRFPLRGTVIFDNGTPYISLGLNNGLTGSDQTGVVIRERTVAGSVIPVEVGSFVIERKFPSISEISPVMNEGVELVEGDRVEIRLIEGSQGNAQSSPAQTPAAPQTGRLVITGPPVGTEVYFNNELLGIIEIGAFERELEPSSGVVEVRAEGFVSQSFDVTITATETLNLDVQLLAAVARLTVRTAEPEARVFLNGEEVGVTPLTGFERPPGSYELRIEKEGFGPIVRSINLEVGKETVVEDSLTPLPAFVSLSVDEPQYEVLVDGVSQGQVEILSLPPGNYLLEIAAEGKATVQLPLSLEAGQVISETVQFEAQKAQLTVVVTPDTAQLNLNGQSINAGNLLELSEGNYTLEVKADGFASYSESFDLVAGQTEELAVTLEPLAVLKLNVNQAAFEVLLNGASIGQQTELQLEAGSYTVEVRAENVTAETFSIDLSAGQELARSVELQSPGGVILDLPVGTQVVAISSSSGQATVFEASTESPQAYSLLPDDYRLLITLPDQTTFSETVRVDSSVQTLAFPELNAPVPPDTAGTADANAETQENKDTDEANTENNDSEASAEDDLENAAEAQENAASIPAQEEQEGEPLALAAGEAAVVIETNFSGVRITFESSSYSEEISLSETRAELTLPEGIYTYKAIASGASPIEDVLFLSSGLTEQLSLQFEATGIQLMGGTFFNNDRLDLLLVSSIQADDPFYRLSLVGPPEWYSSRPLVTRLEQGNAYLWLGDIEALDGNYEATVFEQLGSNTRSDFSVNIGSNIEPVSKITTKFEEPTAFIANWIAPEESESYKLELFEGDQAIETQLTDETSVAVTNRDLRAGQSYSLCVTNFNWSLEEFPTGQPNAARSCAQVTAPRPVTQGSDSDTGGGTTPEPPTVGPPPPPPPPEP